ncbi:hypothetical protein [Legionella clemsonensis]|uniref:Transmembrane protein n=1 Tax=Legionella clemsonensis TaxID=1867846 RepID=A0A222NYM0_9GAMM|nr:hypothetical protein [Legionella clemsonensis]ASQ44671.1 hypothetical protein clem_00525 [Legionella clemsonensis]
MTSELTPENSESVESSSIYLIAGRMDAQSRLMAKRLHELRIVYAIYGALDGLSLSYSMIKYTFDLLYGNGNVSTSDLMHEWMLTPEGIAAAATSTITLVVFAMLANHFQDDDANKFKSYLATVWPYCRDTMKGLKNAYKGFRSAVQVIDLIGGQNLNFMIVPMGLLLGVLSAANRIWFRYQVNIRKDMMKANAKLLDAIKNSDNLSLAEIEQKHSETKSQSMTLRRQMLLSAAYGGVVDGLYLYVGVLSLCALAPQVFLAMTVFCAVYFIACIATRIYEEYDFQRRLVITQAKIDLALCGKKLEVEFLNLMKSGERIGYEEQKKLFAEQKKLFTEINHLYETFEKKRAYLRELSTLSYSSAFLAGMKNGLAAYGALASLIFGVATILVLASASFPPFLLITCISMGMGFLIAFIAHSLIHAHRHQIKQEAETIHNPHNQQLNEILVSLKQANDQVKEQIAELKPEKIKTAITDGMVVDPSPQFFFQEWFEVVRSFFSGLGKGSKAVDFTMNSFQERGADGHYHDTPIMVGITALSALVHGIALALRAQARGFGKDPIDKVPSTVNASETGGAQSPRQMGNQIVIARCFLIPRVKIYLRNLIPSPSLLIIPPLKPSR